MMGEPHDRLTQRHHLARLGQDGGDHTVGVGLEIRVGKLVAREFERTLRPLHPAFGFVPGGLLALIVGRGRKTALAQVLVALLVGGGLGQIGGGGRQLGLGALDLQAIVTRVEAGDDIAGPHLVAHVDKAGHDLAGDAEAKVRFVARPHDAGEFAILVHRGEGDALHLHRPRRRRGLGYRRIVAAGKAGRESGEEEDGADGGNVGARVSRPPLAPPRGGDRGEGNKSGRDARAPRGISVLAEDRQRHDGTPLRSFEDGRGWAKSTVNVMK